MLCLKIRAMDKDKGLGHTDSGCAAFLYILLFNLAINIAAGFKSFICCYALSAFFVF